MPNLSPNLTGKGSGKLALRSADGTGRRRRADERH